MGVGWSGCQYLYDIFIPQDPSLQNIFIPAALVTHILSYLHSHHRNNNIALFSIPLSVYPYPSPPPRYSTFTPRRKIRLIESNAKCRHLKEFTCKWTLRQVLNLVRYRVLKYAEYGLQQNSTPPPPSCKTLSVCIYCTLTQGRGRGGRGGVNQRQGLRGNSSQSWVEICTNMTDCISRL